MAYEIAWDETIPGGSIDANKLDDAIRDTRKAIRERLADAFGGMSLVDFQTDPLRLKGIRGGADADFEIWGGTDKTTLRDASGAVTTVEIDHDSGDVTATGDITAGRDVVAPRHIVAAGGYRQLLEGWSVEELPINTEASTELSRPEGRSLMLRPGSVTGVGFRLGDAFYANNGGLSIQVWRATMAVGGSRTFTNTGASVAVVPGGLTARINYATFLIDQYTFDAGDELYLVAATTTGFTTIPSNPSVQGWVEVET